MALQAVQTEYLDMPPLTRAYTTACVLTSVAVVSPLPQAHVSPDQCRTWSGMALQAVQTEYLNMPPLTRAYTTACVLTSVAVVSPLPQAHVSPDQCRTWSGMALQAVQTDYLDMPPLTRAYTTACVLTSVAVVSPLPQAHVSPDQCRTWSGMALQAVQTEYLDMPPLTRAYTTACVLTSVAVQLDIVTPFQLYFNPTLIFYKYEVWRLVTSFCFFGTFGFSFLFNMIFTYRYCRMLEEGSFRGRPADFAFMFIFGGVFMVAMALFVHMVFLGQALTIMLVYVWSRRNPYIRMNFFGLLNFHAPYLPWVLLAFSVLLGNSVIVDFMGIACGHFYYFLVDVFPQQQNGFPVLVTPHFLKWLLEGGEAGEEADYAPLPEDQRPGGFDFRGDDPPPDDQ